MRGQGEHKQTEGMHDFPDGAFALPVGAPFYVAQAEPPVSPATQPVTPATPVLVTTPALSAQRTTVETLGVVTDNPLPDTTFTWGGYFQAIGVLIVLLIALWFGMRMIRRLGTGRFMSSTTSLPRQALRLEAQLPLGQHKGVFVVRFLNKRLVLGVTDQQITLLTETEVRDDETNNPNFQQVMHSAQSQDLDAVTRQSVDSAGAPGPGIRS